MGDRNETVWLSGKKKIEVTALRETDPVFLETRPTFYNGIACEIKEVNMEYESVVTVL